MNYRRGLQRLYAVVASVWIVAVIVAIFSGQFQPWKSFETPISQTVEFAPSELSTTPPTGAESDAFNLKQRQHEYLRESAWAFGLALLPVGVAYLLLFTVTGWIYRGFRS